MVSLRARVASDMKTVRKDRRPVATAAAPSFNPLTGWTTDPVHGVWASDPLWTPPADGGAVSSWRNGGSVGTPNFTQATGTKQPTYRASTAAFNNKPTVQADGTDDSLAATFGAAVSQPFYVVAVAAKSKAANAAEALWDDASVGAGAGYPFFTDTGASTWRLGGFATLAGGTADTNPHLVNTTSNGVSSAFAVDGTTIASGTTGAADPATGVTLLAWKAGGALFSGGHIALWLLFNTNPTALPEWAAFKAWVTSTYGITVA